MSTTVQAADAKVTSNEDSERETFIGGAEKTESSVDTKPSKSRLDRRAMLALGVLVLQNAGVALVGRFALSSHSHSIDTVVVVIELVKLCTAFAGTLLENNMSLGFFGELMTKDSMKMAVPALLYFVQNNLVLMSLERLPTAIFQVTYQCKILTTAFFSVVWLNRSINKMQVLSLLILTIGVAIVQSADVKPSSGEYTTADQVAGFVYVLIACLLSGVAGVYFELVLKSSKQSIMFRNFQLAGFTLLLGAPWVIHRHSETIWTEGLTKGYDSTLWVLIAMQAFGGFVVATVVKYADQVQKGFAVSFAIVLGSVLSMVLFNVELQLLFWLGAALVVSSVYLYNYFK